MDMLELAEQVLVAVNEFVEDSNNAVVSVLEEAISSEENLDFAIDAGISYLRDCDCEDADYFTNKFEQLTKDEDDF